MIAKGLAPFSGVKVFAIMENAFTRAARGARSDCQLLAKQ